MSVPRSSAGRPDWLSFALWEQLQLEAAPEEAALLLEIVVRANSVQEQESPSGPSTPSLVEVRLDRRMQASACVFDELVLAIWLTARRARIARSAGRPRDLEIALAEGARLLLFANEHRPSAYIDRPMARPAPAAPSRIRLRQPVS